MAKQGTMKRHEFLCAGCGLTSFSNKGACRGCKQTLGWQFKARGPAPSGPPQDQSKLFAQHARRNQERPRTPDKAARKRTGKERASSEKEKEAQDVEAEHENMDMCIPETTERPHKEMKDGELREAIGQCEAVIRQLEALQMPSGLDEAKARLLSLRDEKWQRRPQGVQLLIAQSGLKKASQTREKQESLVGSPKPESS